MFLKIMEQPACSNEDRSVRDIPCELVLIQSFGKGIPGKIGFPLRFREAAPRRYSIT